LDVKKVVVDPFITKNPSLKMRWSDVGRVGLVAVMHAYLDHHGDAEEFKRLVLQRTKADVIIKKEGETVEI